MSIQFKDLLGMTMAKVRADDSEVLFESTEGRKFKLFHQQDCCENVYIEDVNGDLSNLIGSPILQAEESSNSDNPKNINDESHTWTFYKIATAKGHVVIRFYGESNGCYAEDVSFEEWSEKLRRRGRTRRLGHNPG